MRAVAVHCKISIGRSGAGTPVRHIRRANSMSRRLALPSAAIGRMLRATLSIPAGCRQRWEVPERLTQTWLAVSDDEAAKVSGRYWYHRQQRQPASEVTDPDFQDRLMDKLGELTGIRL